MEDEQVIRKQMGDTRTALTEKLETLENKVVETVKGASEAVGDTVETVKDSVQETVTTVTGSVQEAVGAVKESVQNGVDTVKDWLDVGAQVDRHPWCAMAAAVCAGYCLEILLEPQPAHDESNGNGFASKSHNGHGRSTRRHAPKSSSLLHELRPEINQLKGLALGTALGVARDMIVKALPRDLASHLGEVIDNATRKLGGEPIAQETFAASTTGGRFGEERSRRSGPRGPHP
jgi:ElaB/YqjD/DUF883 family membrane-anchored ribosome-binding protein